MGALVLKSKNSLNVDVAPLDFIIYKQRVINDGGVVVNETEAKAAIAYANANNLNASNVFSATSASWGVKKQGTKLVKLYSLFDEKGDMLPVANMAVEITEYNGRQSVYLSGSAYHQVIKTAGTFSGANSVAVATSTSVPAPAGRSTYSIYEDLVIASVSTVDKSSGQSVYDSNGIMSYGFTRTPVANNDITTWKTRCWLLKDVGSSSVATSAVSAAHLAYASNAGVNMYYNNSKVIELAKSNDIASKTSQEFMVGAAHPDFSGEAGAFGKYPFLGYVFEAWCLINVTEEQAQVLSVRISRV